MSAPTQSENILMDLFEAKSAYENFLRDLAEKPPMEWPDVKKAISLQERLREIFSDACTSGYAYTRRWRRTDG